MTLLEIMEKCDYCGQLYIRKNNAQKYCSLHCKHEAQLESKRRYINNRNLQKHYNTRVKSITELGSLGTTSSCHRKSSFEEEIRSIRRMKKMLRI